jgi:hypothetical protein
MLCHRFKKNVFTLPYTKLKLLLKQFISVAVTQLEKCDLPPSELTTHVMLSCIADPSSIANPNNVMFI